MSAPTNGGPATQAATETTEAREVKTPGILFALALAAAQTAFVSVSEGGFGAPAALCFVTAFSASLFTALSVRR